MYVEKKKKFVEMLSSKIFAYFIDYFHTWIFYL